MAACPKRLMIHRGNLRPAWKNARPGDWSCSPEPDWTEAPH